MCDKEDIEGKVEVREKSLKVSLTAQREPQSMRISESKTMSKAHIVLRLLK